MTAAWQKKIKRKTIEEMDGLCCRRDYVVEDLTRASVTKFGKTSGRQRRTLCDIAEDREQWMELVALASMTEAAG